MKLISFDPGKATGWCLFDTDKDIPVQRFGITHSNQELYKLLDDFGFEEDIKFVICEDYINRPAKSGGFDHTWDKGFTHRVIGTLSHWSWQIRSDFILQQPMIKPAAYGMLGLKYEKGKKNVHHIDAMVHGYNFILARKILPKQKILLRLGNKSGKT